MSKSGGCLCGAVRYDIASDLSQIGACHCEMCRRWSGGVYMAVKAAGADVTLTGTEHIGAYNSSDWAERGFCKTCGSSLYYRVTLDGPHKDTYHFASGTLDDHDGLTLTEQLFIDLKPDGYGFTQKTHDMTAAQIEEMFAGIAEQS